MNYKVIIMHILKIVILLLIFSSSVRAAGIDISSMESGELKIEEWGGIPVLIYKRSPSDISDLKKQRISFSEDEHLNSLSRVARSNGNEFASALMYGSKKLEELANRSQRKDIIVLLGISTFYGCAIDYLAEKRLFTDPCSKTEYGLDGRITNPNQREYYHLLIPPHYYEGDYLYINAVDNENIPKIDFSPDIQSMNISSNDKLIEATQWGEYDLVSQILNKNIDNRYELPSGATALHIAAYKGSPDIIRILHKHGFNLNKITREGVTPIQLALLIKKTKNINTLMLLGAKTKEFCNGSRCAQSAFDYLKSYHVDITKAEYLSLINVVNTDKTTNKAAHGINP